jgi:CDP-diacylglycerol--glycerol-3-phosphate 3-phosphatidyltransferase
MVRLAFVYLAAASVPILPAFAAPELPVPVFGPFAGAAKAGAILAWQYIFLLRSRARALEGENLDRIWGWANRVSLARGILLAWLGSFLFIPEPAGYAGWLPAGLYAAAAAADYLDGYIAKRTGTRTELGALLDGHLDGIGLLLALSLAVQYERLPVPFLVLGLAKPLYSVYLGIHRRGGGGTRDLPPSYLRRRLAGFLMAVAAAVLWPEIDRRAAALAACLVGIPFLAGFLRDALAASDLLDPRSPGYQAWKGRVGRFLFGTLPPVLRLTAGLSAAFRAAVYLRAVIGGGKYALVPWFPEAPGLPPWPGLPAALAALQVAALAVAAAGRPRGLLAPAWAAFLLAEALRSSGAGLDAAGALSLAAVLGLFVFRPRESEP